ncbi:MAG TPA: protein-glutamate O-methyltransferase CheR [Hyphomicrobium sp.]|nr:protein-glutamate O-methyltransferase CheR [Hyphomicrobium sp.]
MSSSVALRKADETINVSGEFPFSKTDFREIAKFVKDASGIELSESKASLVYSRLTKRLRARSLKSFAAYRELVAIDEAERNRMLSALTTNVTKFYREIHHFEHLAKLFRGPLGAAAKRGERIRLWSAACSSGQEPHSMALAILGVLPEAPQLDIKILASDLSSDVVNHGRKGIYRAEELQDIPADVRKRWIEPIVEDGEKQFRVSDVARELITFRELNLMEKWPMRGPFQVIFCRNVVIYFDQATQAALWQRFAGLLPAGGTLYIGHSERLSGPATSQFCADGITTFQLTKGAGL